MNRLDAIQERLSKATPEPWAIAKGRRLGYPLQRMSARDGGPMPTWRGFIKADFERDAQLIIHAPADLRDLLAVARAVEDLLEATTLSEHWLDARKRLADGMAALEAGGPD